MCENVFIPVKQKLIMNISKRNLNKKNQISFLRIERKCKIIKKKKAIFINKKV